MLYYYLIASVWSRDIALLCKHVDYNTVLGWVAGWGERDYPLQSVYSQTSKHID